MTAMTAMPTPISTIRMPWDRAVMMSVPRMRAQGGIIEKVTAQKDAEGAGAGINTATPAVNIKEPGFFAHSA